LANHGRREEKRGGNARYHQSFAMAGLFTWEIAYFEKHVPVLLGARESNWSREQLSPLGRDAQHRDKR
jgi:hypothetical protein